MSIAGWPRLRWMAAAAAAVLSGVVLAVPTGIVPTPFYTRMTPVLWWNYPVWLATAVVSGLLAATYVRTSSDGRSPAKLGLWANMGSLLAVGCPVCNKLVVAAIGVSGALHVWAPLQPVAAAASLAVLGWALRRRLSVERSCPAPSAAADGSGRPGEAVGHFSALP
ncbi:hypothetical protein [Skermania sp. ID1734]|uniref:hypothetical protein n=1 Tax=Skermania sp. ID1734 TaxID=2597516 RepID=UPI00163D5B3E|nr:hypothetical protein [Skermania sp. ID1734]